MNVPDPGGADQDKYQPLPKPILSTRFRSIHDTIWEAEARFDLLFRRDHGVHPWVANRVQSYYRLAAATGIYDPQKGPDVRPEEPPDYLLDDLPEVDVYLQTGALGPATANRARPYGCIYTQDYVRWLLDHGRRVLLLTDAGEGLVEHPNLFVLHSRQLYKFGAQCKQLFPKLDQCALTNAGVAYWKEVDDFFDERLGVRLFGREQIEKWIHGFQTQLATQREVFRRVRPKAFMCMTHYFRAPQILAAREVGARTIDFQHGINSKFHLGYGFPNLRPAARDIPYYPDEFWSWGRFWAPESWFPTKSCDVRVMGHYADAVTESAPDADAPRKSLLIATSWAMQSAFKEMAERIAARLPDWEIVLKLHPREETASYQEVAAKHGNIRLVSGDQDVIETARGASVVLSICSSSLFDVLLAGSRIVVMHLEGVEYAEDFVEAFAIPVLEADASNIEDCIERALGQSIELREVFAGSRAERLHIAMNSILGPAFPLPRRPEIANPEPVGRRKGLSGWSERLATRWPDAALKYILPGKEMPAQDWAVAAKAGVAEALPAPWAAPFWKFAFRNYWKRHPAKRLARLDEIVRQIDDPRFDNFYASAVTDLLENGMPTARYRRRFLEVLQRLRLQGQRRLFERGLDALLSKALTESAPTILPLFEHALVEGKEAPILKMFDVPSNRRRWREAAALIGAQNPTMAEIVRAGERLIAAADEEFMDTRVSAADVERLHSYLEARIAERRPFAMMRLGDGEAHAFDPAYVEQHALDADYASREMIWWGRGIDAKLRARLGEGLVEALKEVDLLGFPSSFRLLRDLPHAFNIMRRPMEMWAKTTRAHVILSRELDRMLSDGQIDLRGRAVCDDRCHQELFTPERTRRLLKGAEHVVGVNCFARERLNEALGGELIQDHVLLPPHNSVRDFVDGGPLRDVPMALVLDDLLARIDEVVRPGSVVLMAGGFAGKTLIGRAKQRGGIVLDVGASADYWMGVRSRGELDFASYR